MYYLCYIWSMPYKSFLRLAFGTLICERNIGERNIGEREWREMMCAFDRVFVYLPKIRKLPEKRIAASLH